jgi:DNA-binding transcriptional LysR family regulator
MDLNQLRCFVAVAEELHFGKAAQRLAMLPSSLGRHVRLLEENLGTALLLRTTRNVALTADGRRLVDEARLLLAQADGVAARFRAGARDGAALLRVGAIDSAAAGLLPQLLQDFRREQPGCAVQLLEDKTIRLLPKLLSGRLDLAILRPPDHPDSHLDWRFLFYETVVVALPAHHELAHHAVLAVTDLADQAMIVPERRSRPHSHDLTMQLFAEAGLSAQIGQWAQEKHTIVNLVAAGIGIAIVPRWTARMRVSGVRFIPLAVAAMQKLPLAACWVRETRDPMRDDMIRLLLGRLAEYSAQA